MPGSSAFEVLDDVRMHESIANSRLVNFMGSRFLFAERRMEYQSVFFWTDFGRTRSPSYRELLKLFQDNSLVFGEDGRRRKAVFMAEVAIAENFLPRQSADDGPARRADTDDSPGANTFDDEVRLKTDLDAAAPQRNLSGRLRDLEDGAM